MSTTNGDYVRIPLTSALIEGEEYDIDGNLETQVFNRLVASIIPNPRSNFIESTLKPRADLYGPFWVATTLILTAAIGGNVSDYFQSKGKPMHWHYDFQKVTLALTIIYSYWWLVPMALSALFYFCGNKLIEKRYNENDNDSANLLDYQSSEKNEIVDKENFVDLLSVYGYSLTVFVPISILWTIQNIFLQWVLEFVALFISGAFLVFTLLPVIRKKQYKFPTTLLIIGLVVVHIIFSFTLMVAFFYGSPNNYEMIAPPVVPVLSVVKNGSIGQQLPLPKS